MLILLHVILALAGLGLATYNFFSPSQPKLKQSYILAAETLATGVLLIVVNSASILRTCLTGIAFFGVVSILNESARRKLAAEPQR